MIPQYDGRWTVAAAAHARVVARLRDRGHTLEQIRQAGARGRLAFGYVEELFRHRGETFTLEQAARETRLAPALVKRIFAALGMPASYGQHLEASDLRLLRHIAAVLEAGFPLVALLQLLRVYGSALMQIADAEVRLFHLYVHEPLIRQGVPGLDMAEEMEGLARELLPLSSPVMDHLHQRFVRHFIEQDVVGHMEVDLADVGRDDLGRMNVTIAFADLAGYSRLTEELGEEAAVGVIERFVEGVVNTLPDDARVIKTIGDEVMIVASDPGSLTDWAVGFQTLLRERPMPRIGIHYGSTLYRDGDYYGRDVNQAARVAARAAGGEVLVTRPVVEHAGPHLVFDPIGQVRLKGFPQPTELFLARQGEG